MRTALDSSVILDLLTADVRHGTASEAALRHAASNGQLIIGECVVAEIVPAIGEEFMGEFLEDWRIDFIPSSKDSSRCAGGMYAEYLKRRPSLRRVLPDFLIGAHALHHADRLLARDRGYYRDYFSSLVLVEP